ncbi:hypothetical protein WDW89_04870 [Deltaproteobacteria bacterium TL4]
MRRLIWFVVLLALFSLLGYLGYLNDRNVAIGVFGDYTVHFSLWVVILGTLLIGFLSAELRMLFFHPDRIFRRIKQRQTEAKQAKYEQLSRDFYQACILRDLEQIGRTYGKLKTQGDLPVNLREYRLRQKQYQLSEALILDAYYQLKQQFPANLHVLLPYQQLAIEQQNWVLVEQLSQEINDLVRDHPNALEGFCLVHRERQEWEACVQKERALLKRFPNSLVAERIYKNHESHLLKAFQQNPLFLKHQDLGYLPNKNAFKELHHVALTLAEAAQLHHSGQSLKAANVLKRCYEKTLSPIALDELEHLYFDMGENPKILNFFYILQQSETKTIAVDLVLIRMLYKSGKWQEAHRLLDKVGEQSSPLPLLYYALKYQYSTKQETPDDELQAARILLQAGNVLENLYQCRHCGATGNWTSVCSRCNAMYTYSPRIASGVT